MKKLPLLTLVLLSAMTAGALARPIDSGEGQLAALSVVRQADSGSVGPMGSSFEIADVRPLQDRAGDRLLGYVYELEPRGYIVVAPDTDLTPVIAVSFENAFSWDEGPGNVLLRLLRADLGLRLDALGDGALSPEQRLQRASTWESALNGSASATTSTQAAMIGPLLEAPTWAQSTPWNDLAPIDPSTGRRSLAGCVATSLAQIINYWQYPSSVSFSSSNDYVTKMRGIQVSAPDASITAIDYPSVSFYSPDDGVMAELSLAAGVSVRMDYTSEGSGAYATDIAVALAGSRVPAASSAAAGVWGYDSAEVRTYVNMHWSSTYTQTAAAFFEGLVDDLKADRPAILCVTISGTSIGHTVIADGYDPESGRYHLNLGWGGFSDGWYALPEDMPPGYNIVEYGILNIAPPDGPAWNPGDSGGDVDPTVPGSNPTMAFSTSPNPFSRQAVFEYLGGETPDFLSVSIYSLAGDLVWTRQEDQVRELIWNGQDEGGESLANGGYVYVMMASVDGSLFSRRGTVILQR